MSRNRVEKREGGISRTFAKMAATLFLLTICCASLWAQSPGYTDFTSAAHLALNGNAAAPVNLGSETSPINVLRLNPAQFSQHGSAWFDVEQPLTGGFTSVFTFQISNSSDPELSSAFPADGLAFVIQGVNPDAPASGLSALGDGGGGIGYQGIPNSLAIEFDTFLNAGGPNHVPNNDPDANHVGVQSCGTGPNSADHGATYNDGTTSCNLGLFSPETDLHDGQPHTVTVNYQPSDPGCFEGCSPLLFVNLDGTELFPNGIQVDLSALLTLDNGKGIVGFTGATGALVENNDILSWSFTPHTSTSITQTVSPGVTTAFVFGEYNYKITPDAATNSSTDTLKVTAIPVDPSAFNAGPNFPGAQCVPYSGNNGKCAEFQVECTGPDCNTGTYQLALNWDNLVAGTTNPNPGLLDAPDQSCNPPSGNAFTKNIFTDYQVNRQDPVVKGSGGPRYSCFVVVENVTYGNADLIVGALASPKVRVGSDLTYTIGLTNFGPATANRVFLTDQLDPNTSFVSGSVAQTTCTFRLHGLTCTKPVSRACSASGSVVTCPVGVLTPISFTSITAAVARVLVTVNPTACGSYDCMNITNTATVSAINPDPRPKNNSFTVVTRVTKSE